MSKEKPILFSGPMVRAILEGKKTQTRRVMKPQFTVYREYGVISDYDCFEWDNDKYNDDNEPVENYCPYGQPGDRLWVRESLRLGDDNVWRYSADDAIIYCGAEGIAWAHHKDTEHCPSIHMPRWASRITLEVTGVRVEQLQQIGREDAIAEGLYSFTSNLGARNSSPTRLYAPDANAEGGYMNPIEAFENLWDSINAKRGYSWESNPWVFVVEFKVV